MSEAKTLVNHMGLTVSSIEKSLEFYCDVVGMELWRRGKGSSGEWYDTLTENEGAVSTAVMVRADGFVLQLVEYFEGGIAESVTGHCRVGNVHLCINVDDVDAKYEQVKGLGKYRMTEIVSLPAGGLRTEGMRSFYVRDPDGVPVEFLYIPDAATA